MMKKPKIVPVPEKMQKFYGVGQMLHPAMEMVEELIALIPKGKVVTIDAIAKKLATNYNTDVTCPMRTGNHLKSISKMYTLDNFKNSMPFWRVIRTDKRMLKLNNYEYWAAQLEKEGFTLEYTKSNEVKIKLSEDQLYLFE